MKKLSIIFISIITLLLFSICCTGESHAETWDEKLNKGLFRLTFDAFNNPSKTKGHIYTVGDDDACELYFNFTQFMEPNLLVFTYLPGRGSYHLTSNLGNCREFRELKGRRIAIKTSLKLFKKLRIDGRDYVKEKVTLLSANFGLGTRVQVIRIIKIKLSSGRFSSMPILKILLKERLKHGYHTLLSIYSTS